MYRPIPRPSLAQDFPAEFSVVAVDDDDREGSGTFVEGVLNAFARESRDLKSEEVRVSFSFAVLLRPLRALWFTCDTDRKILRRRKGIRPERVRRTN